jgi:hypothetical protein
MQRWFFPALIHFPIKTNGHPALELSMQGTHDISELSLSSPHLISAWRALDQDDYHLFAALSSR